jgi:hypothetical protein
MVHSIWKVPLTSGTNAIFMAYAMVKRSHDEPFVCYMTFAYLWNNNLTFVSLFINYMMLFNNVLLIGFFRIKIMDMYLTHGSFSIF